MKRNEKSLTKNYITAKLFLEDLRYIEATLKEVATDFKIKTEDYEFPSVDEFKKAFDNQVLTNVEIKTHNPYVSIDIKKLWVRLYVGNDDVQGSGIFQKLDLLISKTSRKPTFLYSYYFPWLTTPFILILGVLTKSLFLCLVIWIPLTIWLLWCTYIRLFHSGEVILSKRGDVKNFFSRNKDALIVNLVTNLAAIIVSAIVTTYWSGLQDLIKSVSQ